MFLFQFRQEVLGTVEEGVKYVRHSIKAENHLEAFKQWCALPSIQNIDMTRLGTLTLDVGIPFLIPSKE